MTRTICKNVLVAGAFFVISTGVQAGDFSSIQLVGNFNGISCEPNDSANDMESMGENIYRKLKLINEPGDPDTIYFKFTADGSYLPMHWGWSFVYGWGTAEYSWSPPSIVSIMPESGYWYFFFNDTTYEYWLHRPDAAIAGTIDSDQPGGVPLGTSVTLTNLSDGYTSVCTEFAGNSFSFQCLPDGEFTVTASAPGYRDDTVTGIITSSGVTEQISVNLVPLTSVQVTTAECERVDGGVMLSWLAYCCGEIVGFNIYRSDIPDLASAIKINEEPVFSVISFSWFDECGEPQVDRYYWLREFDSGDQTVIGPLFAPGLPGVRSSIGQNYPNPFNPATTVPFTVGSAEAGSRVIISFYDISGKMIAHQDLGSKSAGDHTYLWNPAFSSGNIIPSGVYYCRLLIGKEAFTRKLILLR